MSKTQILIDVLLGIGVFSAVVSSVALLFMKDLYERLHYLSGPATLTIICFTAAVIADKHLSQAGIKALLIMVVLLAMNAVLTHATARAARIRQFGRWVADATEIRGTHDTSIAGLNSRPLVDSAPERENRRDQS
ncbi:MAG TPA: monovalent cation/H(+) antiporter subunit G [Candidatus Acidoferrales bacterium]|jgi:monovalent cation/proton antiporter MnhG/PhaG subunit|nr:monovalent cation/H(+) antiporter subunit G [Candidatus Acidoferrales bacterium]